MARKHISRHLPWRLLQIGISVAWLATTLPLNADVGVNFKLIVHASHQSDSIDRPLLSNMFLGRAQLWENGVKVLPVNQLKISKIRREFARAVHQQEVSSIEAYWLKQIYSGKSTPPLTLDSDLQVIEYVTSNPGAIGYVRENVHGRGVAVLRIDNEHIKYSGSGDSADRGLERLEIETLLRRYASALESKDLDALLKVWPNLGSADAKLIGASFGFARTLRVGMDIQDLHISATGATVVCQRRDELVPITGRPIVNRVRSTFELIRAGGGWRIHSIKG